MHKSHPACEEPSNTSKIWRYLDFSKFMSLLDSEELFFVQSDNLPDKFEGLCSKTDTEIDAYLKDLKKNTYLNCWNLNEQESAHMWEVYPKTAYGVAIQSNFEKLKQSFYKILLRDVYIGKVNYTNSILESKPKNTLEPFFRKREYFNGDSEIRAIIQKIKPQDVEIDPVIKNIENGIYVPVCLDILIQKIIISPNAPEFFYSLVQSIVEKYGLKKSVTKSSLSDVPAEVLTEVSSKENPPNGIDFVSYDGTNSSGDINETYTIVTDQKK